MLVIACNSVDISAQSQVFISEKWSGPGGITAMYHHNVSKTDSQRNVYVAGSTINSAGNHDFILQKFNRTGTLLWEQTHNGQANMDDMAADIFIDDQYNVYVTGTTTEYIQSGYDLCVLKYNSQGMLQWEYRYDNGAFPSSYDAGTAITGDNNGSIFVTGGSMADTTMSDFVTIRLNASGGNEVWTSRYDYSALNDVAAKIAIRSGNVAVAGASQISTSPESWELATLSYDLSDGSLISEVRGTGSATDGVDEIYDITVDDNHIYIAGAVKNITTGFDIRIYKLDDNLNLVWEVDFDGYEGTDKAHGVKVDDDGNVYVAGYVTHPTQGRNYITLKYDADGVLQWNREYNGQASANDEAVQLVIDDQDRIFVTGMMQNNDYTDYVTVGYYSNGDIFGQAIFYSPSGLDDKPSSITIDIDGNLIVTGQCEQPCGEKRTHTVKYKVYDKPFDPVIIDSVPSHNANELLIRFDRSVMNYAAVDNRAFTAGNLIDFVKPQVIDSMNAKVPGVDFKKLEAYKIFLSMTTADSLSLTRLGDTLRLDDFWATLSVILPSNADEFDVADSLNNLYPFVHFAELNSFGVFDSSDDYYYPSSQSGLTSEIHGINIEPAWAIETGKDHIRVGVFDTGINWRHEDFGDGTWEGSKIYNGWDYLNHAHPSNQPFPDPDGHGTPIAGVIGALRNNNEIGIAGIAGGNFASGINSPGSSLYSMAIHVTAHDNTMTALAVAASAIIDGAKDIPDHPTNPGYKLNIQNHSWSSGTNSQLLRMAVETCYKLGCVFVASAGNDQSLQNLTQARFPASYPDDWVLKIGANNDLGVRASFSVYGNELDLIAPGFTGSYTALHHLQHSSYETQGPPGVSIAVPHVSGVAALMLSQHHVNNGYPNNLAPEDVEHLLQNNTSEVNGPGYLEQSGHGRLNAGATLENMTLPEFHILHLQGTAGSYSEVITSNLTPWLLVSMNGVNIGQYNGNLHEIKQTFSTTLPAGHEVIDHWQRHSSSRAGTTSSTNIFPLFPHFDYNVSIDGNVVTVETTTWCWWITTNMDQGPVYKWIPTSPVDVKTAVSLHIQDMNYTSVPEIESDFHLNIFPNPNSLGIFNLEFQLDEPTNLQIEVTDLTGKFVRYEELALQPAGMNRRQLNLGHLSKGLYFLTLRSDNAILTRRVIIQ